MIAALCGITDLTAAILPHPPIVDSATPMTVVATLMNQNRSSTGLPASGFLISETSDSNCVLVTAQGKLLGICTEQDIVRLTAAGQLLQNLTVAEVMSTEVVTITLSERVDPLSVLQIFRDHPICHLPVLSETGEILGIITPASFRSLLQPTDLLRLRLIAEAMVTEVAQVAPQASLLEVAQVMARQQISSVLVTEAHPDSGRRPLGMVTEHDMVQFQALGLDLRRLQVQSVMSTPLFCLSPQHSLWVAHQEMQRQRIRRVVITDSSDRLLGLVTQTNILQALDPDEISKLVNNLQQKVHRLETERIALLEHRNAELEQQVRQRTHQLRQQSQATAELYRKAQQELADRQQAEAALEQERNFVSAILRVAGALIVVLDRQGRIIRFNQTCEQITGYTLQEVQHQPFWEKLIPPEAQATIQQQYAQIVMGQTAIQTCEAVWLTKQGDRRLIRWSNAVLMTDQNQVDYVIGVGIDITEQSRIAAALQQSEVTNRALLEAIPDLMIRMRRDGTYLDFIPTHDFDCIVPQLDLKRKCVFDVMPSDVAQERMQYVETALQTQTTQIYEFDLPRCQKIYRQEARITVSGPDEVLVMVRDVTARWQAELELQSSRAFIQQVLDTDPSLVFAKDQDGRFVFVNQAFANLFARSPAEMLGKTDAEILDNDAEVQFYCQSDQTVLQTRTQIRFEGSVTQPDGQVRWLQTIKQPLVQPDGTLVVLGIATDITERKQAELVLQNLLTGTAAVTGEAFFPVLARHLALALEVDHVLVNQYEDAELRTLAFWSEGQLQPNIIYSPEGTPCKIALEQGLYCCSSQVAQRFPDDPDLVDMGAESYLGIALTDATGRILGNLCLIHSQPLQDRSQFERILRIFAARAAAELERQQATKALHQLNQALEEKVAERTAALQERENSLRQSEELLRLTLDSAPIGIVTVDLNARFIRVNQAFCDIVGYSSQTLLQKSCLEITHPDDRALTQAELQRLIRGETNRVHLQKRYLHRTGESIDVAVHMGLVRNAQGEPLQLVTQVEDIRDRKRAETEMLKALEKEKALSEFKSRFVAMTSHEFRTPLSVISSSAGLLERYSHKLDEAKQQKHLHRIQSTVKHMTQLLDDVLTLHRLDVDQLVFNPVSSDLVTFSANLMEELQISAAHHSLTFLCAHPDSALRTACVDTKLLWQILTNLLVNAIKYSPDGGMVQLQLQTEADRAVFTVRDRGIGISPEDQQRLFEAFHRGANVGNIPGTGLGLAIVRRFVDLHQGQISVGSQLGVGTTFHVKIPLKQTLRRSVL